MSRWLRLAAGVALAAAVAGCMTSRRITTREQFAQIPLGSRIVVYAQHDRVYKLHHFALADSLIHGTGTLTEPGRVTPFDGDIPFSGIVAVRTDSPDVLKTLALAGVTALFVAALAEANRSHGRLDPAIVTSQHAPAGSGTGTSCPYVYAWDGRQYRLQAEPFGVAWGRALEMKTWHLLPAARAEHGIVRLRLADERRETHYVNSVALYRVDLGSAPAAVLDGAGTAWPLVRPEPPVVARDRSGNDILPRVAAGDGRLWECDPGSVTAASGYQDVVEAAFARPPRAGAGSLVLTGINTTFSSTLYAQMCRWVGEQTPALAHAVETDPRLIAELREYTRDASLSVSVWNGRAWVAAGAFLPEANAVPFTRALRIGVPEGAGDTVRVRLRSMADVWRIDAISVDWTDVRPLPMTRVALRSAVGPAGEDLRDDLEADDGRYAILLPPDRIDLTFAGRAPKARGRVAYAVAVRGHLIEWDPPAAERAFQPPGPAVPSDRRIAVLEDLLGQRELTLGMAYADWLPLRTR